MDDKIIVTNKSALKAKYGTAGLAKIKAACDKLIASDKKRGLATRIIYIDDAAAMTKLGGSAVTNISDSKQNKNAVDAIYKKLGPDYLLILGAVDVVPHQDLKNPVPADGDKFADGDLPYACDAPYSKKPEDFVGPTRVVGRLPDLAGQPDPGTVKDPGYLVDLITTAANYKSRPVAEYSGYFAISADVWKGSTAMSLDNVFGASSDLLLSPTKGPKWTPAELKNRLHFINCHGAEASSQFFGQKGNSFPIAHDAEWVASKIVEGTVASVECCYGAELYDPMLADGKRGIGHEYLAGKAYGFFGSTTIAYGPPNSNGAADLICQFFLKHVLEGASLGRAVLEARQEFVQAEPYLDPMDLKTLAQFYLLGDPSIVPVETATPHLATQPKSMAKAFDAGAIERSERRQHLHAKGMWLSENQPVCSSTGRKPSRPAVSKTMREIARKIKLSSPTMLSFSIKNNPAPKIAGAKSMAATAFHVVMPDNPTPVGKDKNINASVCAVAKEVNGKVVSYRELHWK